MDKLSKNEEDYLKALFHLTVDSKEHNIGTNALAEYLQVTPSSANSMIKKLKQKEFVAYEKYAKLELSPAGKNIALQLIRKHRIWETFLYKHLNFTWDEVHEVAEQLEHIKSEKLITELDAFLGFPRIDPHGDQIPDAQGNYKIQSKKTLSEMAVGDQCTLVSVKDGSVQFLRYVSQLGLELSSSFAIVEVQDFDKSMTLDYNGKKVNVSRKFTENVYVV